MKFKKLFFLTAISLCFIAYSKPSSTSQTDKKKDPKSDFIGKGSSLYLEGIKKIQDNKEDTDCSNFYMILDKNGSGMLTIGDVSGTITWSNIDKQNFFIVDRDGKTFNGFVKQKQASLTLEETTFLFKVVNTLPICKLLPKSQNRSIPHFYIEQGSLFSLSDDAVKTINVKAREISQKYNVDLYIIAVNEYKDYTKSTDIGVFCQEASSYFKLCNNSDTAVLVISFSEHIADESNMSIFQFGGSIISKAFNDDTWNSYWDAVNPYTQRLNWTGALLTYLDTCSYMLSSGADQANYSLFNKATTLLRGFKEKKDIGKGLEDIKGDVYLILNDDNTGLLADKGYISNISWTKSSESELKILDGFGYEHICTIEDQCAFLQGFDCVYVLEYVTALPIYNFAMKYHDKTFPHIYADQGKNFKLTDEETEKLIKKAKSIASKYGLDLYIILTDNFQDYTNTDSLRNFNCEISSLLNLSKTNNADAVIFSVNSATNEVYSNVLKNTRNPITEEIVEDAMDTALHYFREKKWFDGLNAYLDEWEALLSGKKIKHDYLKKSNTSSGQAI